VSDSEKKIVSGKFNHLLLLLARQFRQASQADVARNAGMDQGHYSRIENGMTADGRGREGIERVALALAFPVEFFIRRTASRDCP
jgi:transcriptional regulator with XRE-family HTH domain